MVVGKGLIANTLSFFKDDESLTIFASGVSNSGETDPGAFRREKEMLVSAGRQARLVYFSTCSIFDPGLHETSYVKHKLQMEELIQDEFPSHLIIRLPILVGNTPNPHTFFNFIRDRIINGEPLKVYRQAWRYLFDADDLARLLPSLLRETKNGPGIVNMAFENEASVPELVSMFEEILGKKAETIMLEKGSRYSFDTSFFNSFLRRNAMEINVNTYNYNLLRKYLSGAHVSARQNKVGGRSFR